MDLTIVIPCYDEVENVELLASELTPVVESLRRGRSVEIVLVDDGSTDGTGDLLMTRFAAVPDAQVVRHPRNLGLGAALRTGFRHARGEVVVTTDSDASYPFLLILPLLDHLRPGVDVVTASCYHPDGGVENVPRHRVILSKMASLMYRVLVDRRIYTYTCMFRAYRREVLESVAFRSDGFLSVTELLANALLAGYVVREMPCRLRARRHGVSKAKIARTIAAHLRFQWQLLSARGRRVLRQRPASAHPSETEKVGESALS